MIYFPKEIESYRFGINITYKKNYGLKIIFFIPIFFLREKLNLLISKCKKIYKTYF